MPVDVETCSLCECLEGDAGLVALPAEPLCPTCRLRTGIVAKAVTLHRALASESPGGQATGITDEQFGDAMDAHYQAFHATGADLESFDRLFSHFVDFPAPREQQVAGRHVTSQARWRGMSPVVGLLLVAGLLIVAVWTLRPVLFSAGTASVDRGSRLRDLDRRGVQRIRDKDFKGAVSMFDKRIVLEDKSAAAYYCRGYAQFQLGEYQAALGDFRRAVKLAPGNERYQDAVEQAQGKYEPPKKGVGLEESKR